MKLSGKVAIATIGRPVALSLSMRRVNLVLFGRTREKLRETARLIQAHTDRLLPRSSSAMSPTRSCGAPRHEKAMVALARRLAVIMHRTWVDDTEFRWTPEQATAAA